ncbi:hypothetical protein H9Y04_44100 [Streptomyces sp. TRM66268-LWL]|uniref:Uncharacterized protein n=1 Tax=Streptomyces polyasparticus TaxID=2767826 RepID=A0ABR7SVI5_9ACTN|nr:hypothetical protein [Streptomyces polyasparticus]MBC9719505.1 hypothetical protein [Streptomyces polyasparticus]
MARIQILELPAEHDGEDFATPFAIVIDDCDNTRTLRVPAWPACLASLWPHRIN